jgi:hypothetical protein
MFAQVIQGRTTDGAGLRKQLERWRDEVMPGATGYLGGTGGVTPDGEFIAIARFADAKSAAKNNDRPEQGAWWSDTEQYCSDVTFKDSTDVDVFLGGGSDDAGFVQVMEGTVTNLAKARELEAQAAAEVQKLRPDLIGSIRANFADGTWTEFIYFTSEAKARAGEKKMGSTEIPSFVEWQKIATTSRFLDLADPWMTSP